MVDKSLKRASLNGIFHDIKGVQWVWSDHVRGYVNNIGGYSTPHKKPRENTDSRSPAPSLRWQRLVSGVQLAYGWGYHYLELEGKQFRYGGLGMHWTKINTYIRT